MACSSGAMPRGCPQPAHAGFQASPVAPAAGHHSAVLLCTHEWARTWAQSYYGRAVELGAALEGDIELITGRQSATARAILRVTQQQVGTAIGVTSTTLANFETGLRGLKPEHMARLTDYYDRQNVNFFTGRRIEGLALIRETED